MISRRSRTRRRRRKRRRSRTRTRRRRRRRRLPSTCDTPVETWSWSNLSYCHYLADNKCYLILILWFLISIYIALEPSKRVFFFILLLMVIIDYKDAECPVAPQVWRVCYLESFFCPATNPPPPIRHRHQSAEPKPRAQECGFLKPSQSTLS